MATSEDNPQQSYRSFGKLFLGVVLLGALVFAGRKIGAYVPQFAQWVNSLGPLGPLVYILGYTVAAVAFVPGLVLTLAAGAIWGIFPGAPYAFVAAVLGSTSAFLVARYLARAAIERRVASNPRFAALDRSVGAQGRKLVFLLRLSPVFPFNILNYALGLTSVRFIDYVVASVGMLPGTFLYVYYGKLIGDLAALAGGAAAEKGTEYYLVLAVGLLATIIVTAFVTRLARAAVREATGE